MQAVRHLVQIMKSRGEPGEHSLVFVIRLQSSNRITNQGLDGSVGAFRAFLTDRQYIALNGVQEGFDIVLLFKNASYNVRASVQHFSEDMLFPDNF